MESRLNYKTRLNRYFYTHGDDVQTPFNISIDSEYVPISSLFDLTYRMKYDRILSLDKMYFEYGFINSDPIKTIVDVLTTPIKMVSFGKRYERASVNSITTGISSYSNLTSGRNIYLSQLDTVIHLNHVDRSYTPLYILSCKRDDIDYVRKCIMLNREIHPDAVKLFVNEDLDVTRGDFQSIRPSYRKNVKKPLLQQGVEIITVSNFDNMFNRITKPKAASLTGYIKEMATLGEDFIKSFTELKSTRIEEFEITY